MRVLNNGFPDWSGGKGDSPRRSSPYSDTRGMSSPGSEGASSASDGGFPQDLRQHFDLREYLYPPSPPIGPNGRPLIVPSMAVPSSSRASLHQVPGPSTLPAYSSHYLHHHPGPSTYASSSHTSHAPPHPIVPSSSGYGAHSLHLHDPAFSNSSSVAMDPAAWYAAVHTSYIPDYTPGTVEAAHYSNSQGTPNQQWIDLMRDSSMFDQRGASRPSSQPAQPESIPESINMIY